MTVEQIKQLLENYWAGDTSLDEECALKTIFAGDSFPEELKKYQPLFLWKEKQLQLKGNEILKTGFNKQSTIQWYSLLKIAASVLLVCTLGIGIYTHYQQEKYLDQVFSETYSNPEDALKETKNVIGKISSALNLAKEKQADTQNTDSLEQKTQNNTLE